MKKIFALILALMLLLPLVVACTPDDPVTESSSSEQPSQSQESSSTPEDEESSSSGGGDATGPVDDRYFSSKETVLKDWDGKTLNVLATRYGDTAGAPWAQMELAPSSFGETTNKGFNDRQAKIKELYGVTVNWVPAQANQTISGDITTALTSQDASYEIAIPRAHEVQGLVSLVLDMANRDYLTFNVKNDYFNQASYEAFTIAGRTLFIAGDYDFSDEQTSYMLFYNKDMAKPLLGDLDLYDQVKEGTWTYDMLKNLSRNVSGNIGESTQGDEDIYGFATKNVTRFYQYAGIKEADVDPDTGVYRVALNLDQTKVSKVVANIIECVKGTDWARQGQDSTGVNGWGGSWGANATTAFNEGRVLFLDEVAQQFDNIGTIDFDLGVLPFPKLDADQEDYCVPTTKEQTTFMCVPKCTSDKDMSFYFVDVLGWTGQQYVMEPYYERLGSKMNLETIDDDMEILKEYVHDNIIYDIGNITSGWAGFLQDVKNGSYANGTDNFAQLYQEAAEQALTTVNTWNDAWYAYYEDTEE